MNKQNNVKRQSDERKIKLPRKNKLEDLEFSSLSPEERVGLFIKKARDKKGLTQEDLGELLHYKRQNISKWETGEMFPGFEYLEPLCEVLDITLYQLVSGGAKPKSYDPNKTTEIIFKKFKFYISDTKYRIIKISTSIVLFIIFFFSLLLMTINYFKWHIYEVATYDDNIKYVGSIITNRKESIYNFSNFSYSSSDIGTDKEPLIKDVSITLFLDDNEVYSNKISFDNAIPLGNSFEYLYLTYKSQEEVYTKKQNVIIKLNFIDINGEHLEKVIKT